MKVLSPERMSLYDSYAIKSWGIPSVVLMENAGRNTYRLMKEKYLNGKKMIAVVCGRGNNGGDGFVIARYAFVEGFDVVVYLLCTKDELRGDAALNMGLFASLGGRIVEVNGSVKIISRGLKESDIIVDAIFGTGLSKPVSGRERTVIESINNSLRPVIAVDIPSGIDGRTGIPLGAAVKAMHTFTYGYPKLGHVFYPGAEHAGNLTVIDISIPSFIEDKLGTDGEITDGNVLRNFLKPRSAVSHKGTYGHVAVIAGSAGKTGAAHMASLAALKIGAGLVTLAIPSSLNPIMEGKLTEAMTYPVHDEGSGFFPASSYTELFHFIEDKDVVVIGPGLSQNAGTMALVRKIVTGVEKPFVIDADGINALKDHLDILKKAKGEIVLTPHPGELSRIMGMTPLKINADRVDAGRKFVEKYSVNLHLKGARSITFTKDGKMYINPTGNAALAKGGTGDVLTGFLGGLVAQGYTVTQATLAAAYLHGYIADRWTEKSGDAGLLATDLLDDAGRVIKDVLSGKERIYIEKSL